MFDSVLIANRGEIACRIARSAKRAGYRTIAVYSDADRDALHVKQADVAVRIGPAPAKESYLAISNILAAAEKTAAGAIHPGYGFLAENAEFARACQEAGLIFIGPPPEAIELMGSKRRSKERMLAAGVPCVPGHASADQSDEDLLEHARQLGLPLMIKASAGGGGKGLRLVRDPDQLAAQIRLARSEAESAFGDGELILERALERPRHVEIQVFADQHGAVIHLGERDCSVQRRHQKIVEEAPSPAVSPSLRQAMGEAAVAAARSIGYVGAGTIEFLLDESGAFYFMEMNTRLQVEHPVTEMITGLDLVDWQLDIAAGAALPLSQDEVDLRGHAIEVRLYAEDPSQGFLPQTGQIDAWIPAPGSSLRCDHGLAIGARVGSDYDPMLAKLIAHGRNREEALRRLVRGLEETVLHGVITNQAFLIDVLKSSAFSNGEATTAFVEDHFPAPPRAEPASDILAVAAMLSVQDGTKPFWQSRSQGTVPVRLRAGEIDHRVLIDAIDGGFTVTVGATQHELRLIEVEPVARVEVDGVIRRFMFTRRGRWVDIQDRGRVHRIELAPMSKAADASTSEDRVIAPMSGKVVEVRARAGDQIVKGQVLLVLEAMKMQLEITSKGPGTVDRVAVAEGDQVESRQVLVTMQ